MRKDLDRLQAKVQQRQATLNNLKRKIVSVQELVDAAQSEEDINREKDEIQQQVVSWFLSAPTQMLHFDMAD